MVLHTHLGGEELVFLNNSPAPHFHSPVEAYGVKERRQPFHDQKDENGQNREECDDREQQQDPVGGVHPEAHAHQHGPQDVRQL